MATVDDFDGVIERCQQALREFVKGNPEPMQEMFVHREDVTRQPHRPSRPRVGGGRSDDGARPVEPQGGRDRRLRDRGQARYPGAGQRRVDRAGQDRPGDEVVPFPLRVTTIFRPEDGTWK